MKQIKGLGQREASTCSYYQSQKLAVVSLASHKFCSTCPWQQRKMLLIINSCVKLGFPTQDNLKNNCDKAYNFTDEMKTKDLLNFHAKIRNKNTNIRIHIDKS